MAIILYVGDEMKGADRLAARAAGVEPYWEKFENGWYRLEDVGSEPTGPFLYRETAEAEPRHQDERAEAFRELCKKHDLTYAYSDDSRVYRRGRDQYAAIKEAAKKLPPEVAARIWNEVVREKLLPGGESDFLWKEGA